MEKKLKVYFVSIILFYFISNFVGVAWSGEVVVDGPMDVIEVFYGELLSSKPASECSDIFYESNRYKPKQIESMLGVDALNKNDSVNEMLWQYLRNNKNLFLFKSIENGSEIIEKTGKLYSFSKSLRNELITDGNLSIVLFAKLTKNEQDVYKEISFSMERFKDSYTKKYLISIFETKINGIFIFPPKELTNKEKFVEELGLK